MVKRSLNLINKIIFIFSLIFLIICLTIFLKLIDNPVINNIEENIISLLPNDKIPLDTIIASNIGKDIKFEDPILQNHKKNINLIEDEILFKSDVYNLNGFELINGSDIDLYTIGDKSDNIIPVKKIGNSILIFKNYNSIELYKFEDKKLKLLWNIKNVVPHHWVSQVDNNHIYVLSRETIQNKKLNNYLRLCSQDRITKDVILKINLDNGEVVNKIDLLDLVTRYDKLNMFLTRCDDPLHANDVRVVKNISNSSLMVSLRNIDSIIFINEKLNEISHSCSDLFNMQHSPRIFKNYIVLIENNFYSKNYANLVFMDRDCNKSKSIIQNDFIYTSNQMGRLQILNDEIYIQSNEQGEIFISNCKDEGTLESLECSFELAFSSKLSLEEIKKGKDNETIIRNVFHLNQFKDMPNQFYIADIVK